MAKHPTPTEEGHYWAKLVHPNEEPENEDWVSFDWEVVQVWDNNGQEQEQFCVSVAGIQPTQLIDAFIWGPRVPDFKPD